jgi:hypothetical protein
VKFSKFSPIRSSAVKSSVLFEVQLFEVQSFEVGSFEVVSFEVQSFEVGSFEVQSYKEISMSCDRKWNGYSLVREWRRVGSSRTRGELFVGGGALAHHHTN